MKKDSKKSHDAPQRLYLEPDSSIRETGLMTRGGHELDERYWIGYYEPIWEHLEYEEYISLNQSWHEAKEVPEDMHAFIIVANKDFSFATPINLATECLHGILDDTPDKFKWNKIIRHNLRFDFWAYLKDLVPTILKEGGKM